MTSERETIRPVTLGRLVEVTFLANSGPVTTGEIEAQLDVTHRRARETILEAMRIDLITEQQSEDTDPVYAATAIGETFVEAVEEEDWPTIDSVLRTRSPHYGAFIDVVTEHGPVAPGEALDALDEQSEFAEYTYNQTSLDVLGDWGQRLGVIQRNAFSGTLYMVDADEVPPTFPHDLVSAVDEIEETAGVNLSQRYLSIPELREELCELLCCSRSAFDEALVMLAEQNVGRLELSGAPIDTGAKDARFGIKDLSYAGDGAVVTTDGSTEQVMSGVELHGKQYYYLTIHDEALRFER